MHQFVTFIGVHLEMKKSFSPPENVIDIRYRACIYLNRIVSWFKIMLTLNDALIYLFMRLSSNSIFVWNEKSLRLFCSEQAARVNRLD